MFIVILQSHLIINVGVCCGNLCLYAAANLWGKNELLLDRCISSGHSVFDDPLLHFSQGYMDDAVVWKEENEGSEDRISELPDAILHIVLSYLNTEDAVRTSVLSKRWRGVWAHAPNLEFAQNHHLKLADFVNQSLLHYRGSRIQKFCLFMYIEQYCNVGHVWDPRSGLH